MGEQGNGRRENGRDVVRKVGRDRGQVGKKKINELVVRAKGVSKPHKTS